MRVLIDCGASNGRAIPGLKKHFGPFDKVFAIEANPDCVEELKNENINNIEVINAAVSTATGRIKLFLGVYILCGVGVMNMRPRTRRGHAAKVLQFYVFL